MPNGKRKRGEAEEGGDARVVLNVTDTPVVEQKVVEAHLVEKVIVENTHTVLSTLNDGMEKMCALSLAQTMNATAIKVAKDGLIEAQAAVDLTNEGRLNPILMGTMSESQVVAAENHASKQRKLEDLKRVERLYRLSEQKIDEKLKQFMSYCGASGTFFGKKDPERPKGGEAAKEALARVQKMQRK